MSLISCGTCIYWEPMERAGKCTKRKWKRKSTARGFYCSHWELDPSPICQTCQGNEVIYLDKKWHPCPSCTRNPVPVNDDSKDITEAMMSAQAIFLSNLKKVKADPQPVINPYLYAAYGICLCEDCGRMNAVERSHCKYCDSLMKFTHNQPIKTTQNEPKTN